MSVPPAAVARVSSLQVGVGALVRTADAYYALWLMPDGTVRVLDNQCAHVGGPLVDGLVKGDCVVCPWHGWTYSVLNGERQTALGPVPGVGAYPAWVDDDGVVWADIPGRPLDS